MILDVVAIWLLIIVSTEPGQSLIAQVGLNRINASNKHVESTIELLLVKNQWIVHVPLDKVLMVESRLGQVCELFE